VVFGHAAVAVAAVELGRDEEAAAAIAALRAVDPGYLARAEADLAHRNLHPRLVHLVTTGLAKATAAADVQAMARAG
jgi:hypothetical protein